MQDFAFEPIVKTPRTLIFPKFTFLFHIPRFENILLRQASHFHNGTNIKPFI